MKFSIAAVQPIKVQRFLIGLLDKTLLCGLKAVEIVGRRAKAKPPYEDGFNNFAELEDVSDEVVIDDAHPRAMVGCGDNKALALQPPQSFPPRVRAYIVAIRQHFGLQSRTRLERSEERRVGKEWVSQCRSRW